jgi:glycogen debranching enzyme
MQSTLSRIWTYVASHIDDRGLFIKFPQHFIHNRRYALLVTYWKDSALSDRVRGIPAYPIVYTLVQAQYLCAARSFKRLASEKLLPANILLSEIDNVIETLRTALFTHLFSSENQYFYIGFDSNGPLRSINSDSLHVLYYLEAEDMILYEVKLQQLELYLSGLQTKIGYKCALLTVDSFIDPYHQNSVWPFEQAFIHIAASRSGINLPIVREVTSRMAVHLHSLDVTLYPEYFSLEQSNQYAGSDDESWRAVGCKTQLWTAAAAAYFLKQNTTLDPKFV